MTAGEWSHVVLPDVTVSVRAMRRPALLSRILGPEVSSGDTATLQLDLMPGSVSGRRGHRRDAVKRRTVRGVYKAVPWTCTIEGGSDGTWALTFKSPAMREYLALHIAVLPLLRRVLLQREIALVLGAAFVRAETTTVLGGSTGSGKTMLLMGALERGGRFIGDEYIGLSAEGEASPIVRSLALRRTTLRLAPVAASHLSTARKLALRGAEIVTRATGARLEPLNHVPPGELGRSTSDGAGVKIRRFFWLDADSRDGRVSVAPMAQTDLVDELSLRLARHHALYADIGPLVDAMAGCGDLHLGWRQILARGLQGVACARLTFPPAAAEEALLRVLEDDLP